MMHKLILVATSLLFALSAKAQLVPTCLPNQLPPDLCSNACVYCDINGYMGTTVGYTGTQTIVCGGIYVDNDQWLGFVAGDTMANFTVTSTTCQKGDGLQVAIFEKTCVNNGNVLDCDAGQPGGDAVPVTMDNVPLVPGTVYFLMIDGWSSDKCTFKITVDPPSAVIANPLGTSIGSIQGPDTICPGATVTYSVPQVTNAGVYTWTVPAGWLINGQASPQTINTTNGGRTVKIKVGANSGQVCVQAANSCFPDGPSTCKTITVAPLPVNNLPPAYVCNEDKPYKLPWGGFVSNSGFYQSTLKSYFGCDSTVRQQVIIKPPLVTNLPVKTICSGDQINMCGTPYATAGNYSLMCQTAGGCDSLVNFSLSVLAPIAQINGGNTLTCTTSSSMLTASISPAGTLFQWKNSAGQSLGDSTHLLVATPDTYILTATLEGGGIQCVKTDTILIASNTISPSISSSGGTLNCTVSALEMQAISNAAAPTWNWSGPGAFSASIPNPVASLDGTYVVTVTDTFNGCTASATTSIDRDTTLPVVTTLGAILTCSDTIVPITAYSLPAAVTYQWEGPNGFLSTVQSPLIITAGIYTVTATNTINNCAAVDTVEVSLNNAPPGASAVATGSISCTTPGIQMMGNTGMSGNVFFWTGPNGFSSADQNPFVTSAGSYSLVVTGANGCTSESSVLLLGDTIAPNVAASGGTVSCGMPATALQGNSTTIGTTFTWNGPNGFMSTLQNPVASDTGIYTLTAISPNACTATSSAIIMGDFGLPDVSATSDTITCAHSSVPIAGSSVTLGTIFEWTGPGGFFSTLNPVSVSDEGVYILTARAPNGCTAQMSITVPEDVAEPGAIAQGGTLTCSLPTLHLTGDANFTNVQWRWTGPGGFLSNQQNPTIQLPGLYLLEVTNPQNGCLSTATTTVAIDQAAPLAASNTGILTCTLDLLTLQVQSNVPATFEWTGPNGFAFVGANPMVSVPGDYTLVAQALGNGCSDTIVVTVNQDIAPPDIGALGGTLDCNTAQISLTGISATGGAAFLWAGPQNFSDTIQNPVVSTPGQYTLTVTGPNGCQATALAVVLENTDAPMVSLGDTDTLSCSITTVTLFSNIETAGATGVWTGPNNFVAHTPEITIDMPGDYIFTVTAPNGCKSAPTLSVLQNIAVPQLLNTQGGFLNCTIQSLFISISSPSENSYAWSGPGNFSSDMQTPLVTNPGNYIVTATNLANGCTASETALVTQDLSVPDITVQSNVLTCYITSVILNATSNTSATTYDWTGPNNFHATEEDPSTSFPGSYQVLVTGPNGCTATFSYSVDQDIEPPGVTATGDTLTCLQPLGEITCHSATPSATYTWFGPGGFKANQASAPVSIAGLYSVVVTGTNGCISSAEVTVMADMMAPTITAAGGSITCVDTIITLSAISDIGVQWQWSGPGNFSSSLQQPTVSVPGNYLLTATAMNGCISTHIALVEDQTQMPNIAINPPEHLDCNTTQVTLQASATGSGPYSYQWMTDNGAILTGAGTALPVVTQAGLYTVQIMDVVTGCTASSDIAVAVDTETPSGAVLQKRHISCFGDMDGAVKISSMVGGAPPFVYSLDNQNFTSVDLFTGLAPGTHSLLVQDFNGCEYETSFVIESLEPLLIDLGPDTTIHLGESIEITLDGDINFPDRVLETSITPPDIILPATLTPTHSFRYWVAIIDSSGCRAEDSRFILVDRERWVYVPNIFNPNSDNNNRLTVFGGEDVQIINVFQIFDRWGNAIFERRAFQANDFANAWDGRYNGAIMDPAVFVYYAEILFQDGEVEVFKGDVTLIR